MASETRSLINTGNIEPLIIGRANQNSNSYLSGRIDDFRIYNDCLNASEVATISSGGDTVTETIDLQVRMTVNGEVDQFIVNGLPAGLSLDDQNFEITGIPEEIGTFDLNVTAVNRAGASKKTIRLIVLKSVPSVESSKAKNISSSNAQAIAQIISDGGEPLQMTLFWGDNDGGENPGMWDNNHTVSNTHSDGRVSHYIDSLNGGQTYYYRWMGKNSVTDQVWSQPTQNGLIHWWNFDKIESNQVIDSIGKNHGSLYGLSAGSRTFAYNELGLPMTGNNSEKLIISNYKGILGNEARTVALWIQSLDQSSKIIDWGSSESGSSWSIGIEDGKPLLQIDQEVALIGNQMITDGTWKHLAVSFPAGSRTISDAKIYVNGESVEANASFFGNPDSIGPVVWFDAQDLNADGIKDTSPPSIVSSWKDKSGNYYDGTAGSGKEPAFDAGGGPNSKPAVNIVSGKYLDVNGSFFAKDHFVVLRSPPANSIWSSYGGPFGWNGSSHTDARASNYFFWHNQTTYFPNDYPLSGWRNGTFIADWDLSPITDWMILRSVVNDDNTGPHSTYQIGRVTTFQCNLDIAEIIAFSTELTDEDAAKVEAYLARKWGLASVLDPAHLYADLSAREINTVADRDLSIGGISDNEKFSGTLDEIKIYDRGLSSAEIAMLYLDGSVKFTTSSTAQPPVVELNRYQAEQNNSVTIVGELSSVDQNNPTITIYYGSQDHGFELSDWEGNISVNNGSIVSTGEFNATISGLVPGEKYFFRAYAESEDGSDWSSGEPEIKDELLGFWRMDEVNGSTVLDSVIPLRHAEIQNIDINHSRPAGNSGNALELNGANNWLHLDPENSGYLGEAFDGRTLSAWIKINPKVYVGPEITHYKNLSAYFPFDFGLGQTAYDSNFDQIEASLQNREDWTIGKYGKSLQFVEDSDYLSIPAIDSLADFHQDSFSISLWINPQITTSAKEQSGQLHAYAFNLSASDYYYENLENLLNLEPDFVSLLRDASLGDFDPETFSPTSIPGLSLWLDASQLSSADSSWNDQSGLGNHATKNGSPTINANSQNGLSLMNYNGSDGNYHSFNRISDIRSAFWALDNNGGFWYLLGDTSSYHFHTNGANSIFHPTHSHANIKSGSNFRINGSAYNIYGAWPTDFAIYSLVTAGNVQANNFSNDRNIGGRYGNTALGEILVYNQALDLEEVMKVESYLRYKWGLGSEFEAASSKMLSLASDTDFLNLELGGSSYHNTLALFKGNFRALEAGTYLWELSNVDDQAAIWIDLDQDGIFEASERIVYSDINSEFNLSNNIIYLGEGTYRFAVYHGELTETASLEVKFATPSSASGPPSLTTLYPSDAKQSGIFSTENRFSLLRRGPLQLGIDGAGNIFYRHFTDGGSVLVESNQTISNSNWSQVGLTLDTNDSSIRIFVNGSLTGEALIPDGAPLDLDEFSEWIIGGKHSLDQDFYKGKIDDLRIYNTVLNENEMLSIAQDDLTGKEIAGYRKQVIYDEGSSSNGFNLVNDEGYIRAQVIRENTITEVSTSKLIEDTGNSVPFNPMQDTSLNLMLWLDASDRESLDQGTAMGSIGPPSNGNNAQFWRDKSGNNLHAVATSGSPKYRSGGIDGGYPSVETANAYFDLTNSEGALDALEQLSVVFIYKWTNASNTWNSMIWKGSGRGHGFVGTFCIGKMNLGANQGLGVWYYDGVSGKTKQHGGAVTYAHQSPKIFTLIKGYGGNNSYSRIWGNGTISSHNINNAYSTLPSTPSTPVRIGDFSGGSANQYGEILLFNNALSDEDRQIFEGYLAHKWGLNAELSFEHPYYDAPPEGLSTLKKANEVDDNWHHFGVSYGENPGVLKLYLDGQLVDGPVSLQGSETIPSHDETPAVGAPQGTFSLDNFGNFNGLIDDLRVYDRGLTAEEMSKLFLGDVNNSGVIEYRAIQKPAVRTLSALDARPQSVILRAEVTSIGGDLLISSNSSDNSFQKGTISGLQAWYAAQSIAGANGASISSWKDESGYGRDFENVEGNPRLLSFGLNGKPVVSFDGDDLLWTGHNFDTLTNTGYTMLSLARYTGAKNQRVISSRTRNFLFGYHGSQIGKWYAEGWISASGELDNEWHLHLGTIENNQGDPAASFWQDGVQIVSESRGSSNSNFAPGVLQIGGWQSDRELSACEIAEIMIYQGQLNAIERSQLEGYLAHKWNLTEQILPSDHPYSATAPFGGKSSSSETTSIGGDPAEVYIFWGDERIELNSTLVNPDNNATWDYKVLLSDHTDIGTLEQIVTDNLLENTNYYFRAYASNLAGETWADDIYTFRTIDTQFTKDTLDGLLLWLDASDVDGNGERDSIADGSNIPLWLDKSRNEKHATQSILSKMPSYDKDGFGTMPAIDFKSGNSMFIGTLTNLSGPINVFAVAEGDGVAIGADDGVSSWTLEAKTSTRLNSFKGENDPLQQVTLGLDPRTGFGLLTGKIAEVLVFDRMMEPAEREMIEGYLAHKWGILDDLAQSGFSVNNGLVLYYPFNETGGSIVEDYSLDLRHGIVVDADLGQVGKFSSGLGLDGISPSTAKVDLGANELELNQLNWTVSSWFLSPINHPDDEVASDYALTDSEGLTYLYFDKSSGYQLFLNDKNPPDTEFFATSISGTSNSPIWHQITLTSSSNQFIIYLDGSEITRYTGSSAGSLGIVSLGNLSTNFGRFAPAIDDFRVYNRTLSSTEVSVLYGNGEGDFGTHTYADFPPVFDNIPEILLPKDAVTHWKFDDLNGSQVNDSSGLNNHGVVVDKEEDFDLFLENAVEGKRDRALYFDGNLTVKLSSSTEVLNARSAFSVAFWINTEDRDADIINSGRFQVAISDGYLNAQVYVSSRWKEIEPVLFPFGSWVHVILWWDGNKLKFFLNNQEATNSINAKGILSGDDIIFMGGQDGLGSGFYTGSIDDFRFYAHAITPTERDDCYLGIGSPLVTSYGEEYYLKIDTLRGPTDFNASGLPEGLEIDMKNGIIFGSPEAVGNFQVSLQAWNSSGMDEENMTLYVLPGEQSILSSEIGLLRYGDPPVDLNWTSTSGLPVQIEILEGNESVDLNDTQMPCTLTILKPGTVKLQATQPGDGNSTYAPAEKIITELIISKRELLVRIHDQYRKATESNPELTYDLIGFIGDDNRSVLDQNISISVGISDGSIESPSPVGDYPITANEVFSDLYFLSYAEGLLTVSEKLRQELIFDQNLSNISALSPPINLEGYSIEGLQNSQANTFTVSGGESTSPFYLFTDSNGQTPDFSTFKLIAGQTYKFIADGISNSHPFMIGESYGDMNSSLVTGGPLTGSTGEISISIPVGYQGNLFYFCTNHSGMLASFTLADPSEDQSLTNLPLYYEIDDQAVAKLIVTREDALKSHWKFDQSKYAEVVDETGRNAGTISGLTTVGSGNSWIEGKFGNALQLDGIDGLVNFGPLQLDGNFSFSFWVKPDINSSAAGEMVLLSKFGISTMNHFQLLKEDGNGSIRLDYYPDGGSAPVSYRSDSEILSDGNWTFLTLAYNAKAGRLEFSANGIVVIDEADSFESNGSLPFGFRFSNLAYGSASSSFAGMVDDLRYYSIYLTEEEINEIYNEGGGDYQNIKITGFGSTRITAFQNGSDLYEKAIPVYNYLTVVKADQTIDFDSLIDRSVGDFPFALEANASSGLAVEFSVSDLALATLNSNILQIRNSGELTVTASQSGNNLYNPAPTVSQTFSIGYGNLFADSIPGLELWLDATDINFDETVDTYDDFVDQNKISLWADKSGNFNSPVQAKHNQMPIWKTNNGNVHPVVEFDADTNQSLNLQLAISEPSLVFLVIEQSESRETNLLGGDLYLTSSSGNFQLSYNSGNPLIPSTRPTNLQALICAGISAGTQNLWINGDLAGSSSSSSSPQSINNIGQNFSGQIAEILIFNQQVSFFNRQKVEGYLSHKWQLVDSLPDFHPYSTLPPSFGGNQFITWLGVEGNSSSGLETLPVKKADDNDFTLTALASSGLPVIYDVDDRNVLTIAGDQAKILSQGKVIITAYLNGDSRFLAAPPQSVELEIIDFSDPLFQKDDQNITYDQIPIKVREDPPFPIRAFATSSGLRHQVYNLPVTLKIESGPATIDARGVVTLDGTDGTVVVSARQSGNAFVNEAETIYINIEVSSKTRPSILFSDFKNEGSLPSIIAQPRAIVLPGAYSSNGDKLVITSSDPSIIKVVDKNKIIARKTGTVTLSFDVPATTEYAAAVTLFRTIEVVAPTKNAWLTMRRNDPRYANLKQKFINRRINKMPEWTSAQAEYEFDLGHVDSDGDGFSNIYERALGMDSLAFDRFGGAQQINPINGKPTISFVKYKDPLSSTGENFEYIIEQSNNLKVWNPASVSLVSRIDIGDEMERVTYRSTSSKVDPVMFLRLRISSL